MAAVAVTVAAIELMLAVAKAFAAEDMAVPGMVMSTLAVTPVKVEVALKLASLIAESGESNCSCCQPAAPGIVSRFQELEVGGLN